MKVNHCPASKIAAVLFLAIGGCSSKTIEDIPLPAAVVPGLSLVAVTETRRVDLSSALDGYALAAIAVITNPDLNAMRTREGVAEAQAFAAGLYPDPSFSLSVDYPQNGGGLVNALAASLGLDIAALLRRPASKRRAKAEVESVRLDIAWAEWLIAEQAKMQAVRVPYLERSRLLTARLNDLAKDELARSVTAMVRGDLPAASLEVRRLAAADAAARDRDSENILAQARLDLNRTLGLDPDERIEIAAVALTDPSAFAPAELFLQAVRQRADLQGMRAGYEGSLADQALAGLNRYPMPVVAVNSARDTGAIRTIGPNLSLTLPLWNGARGELAIVKATRAQLRAEYVARTETVRADIFSAYTALGIAIKQFMEVADEIQPLAAQADAVDRAVAGGDLSQSAGSATRLALLDKQIAGTGLAMAAAELAIALEIAAGYPLKDSP